MSPSVLMQYLLPHRLLSALAYKLAHSRVRPWKDWLIRLAVAKFGINVGEAAELRLEAYASFNAFFTRALREGARVADPDPATLLQPADGIMSQCGRIESGRIFQAKGQSFTAAELLGDEAMAAPYAEGDFAHYFHPATLAASPDPQQLAAFAQALGLVYMKVDEPDGSYSMDHSATLVLLDPQGRQAGLLSPPFDPRAIAADLRALSEPGA